MCCTICGLLPVEWEGRGAKKHSPKHFRWALRPNQTPPQWVSSVSTPRNKWPERECEQSPPPSGEVSNEYKLHAYFPACLHGVPGEFCPYLVTKLISTCIRDWAYYTLQNFSPRNQTFKTLMCRPSLFYILRKYHHEK